MSALLIKPRRFADDRGWFSETYHAERYRDLGVEAVFCQDNQSLSHSPGVLRGLHFQAPPHAQAKLVSCVRGAIWDVCVDIRKGSPTYGEWVSAILSAENGHQFFVPEGYAHGFMTLEPETHVFYKVNDYYSRESDSGIAWNDPNLNLPWPLGASEPILSDKDRQLQSFKNFDSPFPYDGRPLLPLAESGNCNDR